MTGIRSILATHFVGYLGALMSVLGNSKCFENAALGRMRRLPQNLLATSSSDFDFQVAWLESDLFWPHILLAISAPSCRFLEIQSVLKTPHSGGCDGFLRICWRRLLAISTFKLDGWNQIKLHTMSVVMLKLRCLSNKFIWLVGNRNKNINCKMIT